MFEFLRKDNSTCDCCQRKTTVFSINAKSEKGSNNGIQLCRNCFEQAWRMMQQKDHYDGNENRCVCCGDIIPEGRQVCIKCEKSAD